MTISYLSDANIRLSWLDRILLRLGLLRGRRLDSLQLQVIRHFLSTDLSFVHPKVVDKTLFRYKTLCSPNWNTQSVLSSYDFAVSVRRLGAHEYRSGETAS